MASRGRASPSTRARRDPGSIHDSLEQRIQVQEDRIAVVDALYRFGAGQDLKDDTTHTITNTRIDLEGRQAALFALVEAQHLSRSDHSRHFCSRVSIGRR